MNFGDIYHDKKAQKRALLYLFGLLVILLIFILASEFNKSKSRNVLKIGKSTDGVVVDCYLTGKIRYVVVKIEYNVKGKKYRIERKVEGYLDSKDLCLEEGSSVVVKYLDDNPSEGEIDFNEDIKLPDGTFFNSMDMQRRIKESQ